MTAKLEAKPKERKIDLLNLLILISIAAIIGIYLVTTTVVLSRDGVLYIRNAQEFLTDPIGAVRMYHPGHPFLILLAYKFVILFKSSSSVFTWIYAAQGVTLLCRLLALIPLYFIGKVLVGNRKSFWAVLVLIMLPYPTQFGSGALREWPHILFLTTGFLFLLIGAKKERWWMFGVVGILAGIGHTIRPECIQLLMYGIIWLLIKLLWPQNNTQRRKYLYAISVLVVSFSIVAVPYAKIRGKILPAKLKDAIHLSATALSDQKQSVLLVEKTQVYTAESFLRKTGKAIIKLSEEICDNLMYFFVVPVLLGFHYRFRKDAKQKTIESLFYFMFIVTNILLMILLYLNYGYISRRHCLPLAVYLIFCVPVGLDLLSQWISSGCQKERFRNPQLWFFILLAIGIVICLPKLLRPIRIEKQAFRTAAKWIKENTSPEEVIGISDSAKRIGFYAERKSILVTDNYFPDNVKYIVEKSKKNEERPLYHRKIEERYFPIKQWEMGNSIIIFSALKN